MTTSKGKIHTGNATDDSNITVTATVTVRYWQKFPTVSQVNSRTFSGLSRTVVILSTLKALKLQPLRSAKFIEDESQ